jgi:enoyl-CoA hydratase/carnithine racemase
MMATAVSEHVGFDITDGVAVLELHRPAKRNALSWAMCEAILAHLAAAAVRPEVHVLLIQGSSGVFCAGADLTALKRSDGSESVSFRELVIETATTLADFPVPTVARVEGPCIGAGCSLALACDIRFADPNATFRIPAVQHGVVYDEGSIARLAALVGPSRAARILYTGMPIDATRAERIGLVDESGHDLDRLVADCVRTIATVDSGTVSAHRRLLRGLARTEGNQR